MQRDANTRKWGCGEHEWTQQDATRRKGAKQTDASRIELLNRLVDAGYEQKIMISGDMGRRSYLKAYGGGPGFDFLLTKFVPRLLAEGWDQKLVDRVFVRNPAEYLTYRYCWRHSADYRVRAVGPESSTRSSS